MKKVFIKIGLWIVSVIAVAIAIVRVFAEKPKKLVLKKETKDDPIYLERLDNVIEKLKKQL